MSLKEFAINALKDFDPSKDNPNTAESESLPDGTYDVYVEKAGHRVYQSGYDAIAIQFSVTTGEYQRQKEFININVDDANEINKKYPFLWAKNVKLIGQLAWACDVKLEEDDWDNQFELGNKLGSELIGKQLILVIESGTSKKGKSYTNYSFERYDDGANSIDVTDDDIPF